MNALLVATLMLGAEPTCKADADCVLVTECSCACCPALPRAMTKAEAQQVARRCATLGACASRGCPDVACDVPDPSLVAACRDGRCVEAQKAPPQGCRTDADCTMARDCGCACCPSPMLPMTEQAAQAIREKCARLGPCGDPRKCQGETCVPERPTTAICQANVCVRAALRPVVLDAGVR